MKYELKMPLEMEVAPRYNLLTLLTPQHCYCFTLLYTAKTLTCMPVYIDGEG